MSDKELFSDEEKQEIIKEEKKQSESENKKPVDDNKKQIAFVEKIKTLNLEQKLYLVTHNLPIIKKEGTNNHFKYKYLTESQVNEECKKLLEKFRLNFYMLSASTPKIVEQLTSPKQKVTEVTCKFVLTNIDAKKNKDGSTDASEIRHFTFVGHGADTGDKGIYKATTGARKNCMINLFLLSSGNDPEREFHYDKN